VADRKLTVEIVTAERRVLSTEADMVIAPATDGVVGILPRHTPLLTGLSPGIMVLKRDGEEEELVVSGGFLEVSQDHVLVLADTAERAEEVDEELAAEARERAEAALRDVRLQPGGLQAEAARTALRHSLARLNVAGRRRRRAQP
jgi:F-type H+-transporting ATPase subunit epsilon